MKFAPCPGQRSLAPRRSNRTPDYGSRNAADQHHRSEYPEKRIHGKARAPSFAVPKNNNQWRAKELTTDDAARFQAALREAKLLHPLSHDSYLINLAAPDEELWRRSVESYVIELQRAEWLGIPCVVTHPGSFTISS